MLLDVENKADISNVQYDPVCNSRGLNVDDMMACRNYLSDLGQTPCIVNGGETARFCEKGDVRISGRVNGGASAASSPCFAVSIGLDRIIRRCGRQGGK